MGPRLALLAGFALLSSLWSAGRAQDSTAAGVALPLEAFHLAPAGGLGADLVRLTPDQGGPALRVNYRKPGEERRLVAVEAVLQEPVASVRSLSLSYRLSPAAGSVVRLAVLAWERDGGAWFRASGPLGAETNRRDFRFSLQGMRQAAFSADASGQQEWDQVERLWIGFTVEGAGDGSFELARAALTSEAYRATEAVSLFRPDPGQWSVGADPAVTGQSIEVVEAEGAPCLRLRFRFPGGRHMYYVPSQALDELEFSAYGGLRFTYRASTPPGIAGLLVCVVEGNGQFVATPAPPATGDWEAVTVPWGSFPLGAWSQDDNGRLDVDAITRICVGVHGTSQGEGGEGEILIRDIEAVPAAP